MIKQIITYPTKLIGQVMFKNFIEIEQLRSKGKYKEAEELECKDTFESIIFLAILSVGLIMLDYFDGSGTELTEVIIFMWSLGISMFIIILLAAIIIKQSQEKSLPKEKINKNKT